MKSSIGVHLGLLVVMCAALSWHQVMAVTPVEVAKLLAADGAASDRFGFSIAVSGDTAIIGARGDDDAGAFTGSAYVFARSGTTWSQQAKLTAVDGAAGDQFGFSVAVSGDTAIIGARGDDDAGFNSGSAYVFIRSGTNWSQQAKLTAADGAAGDLFGFSVAISGDSAVIGAHLDDDAGVDSGSAYVFIRSGTSWSQQAKLTAADGAAGDFFGFSVAISGDSAVIGAHLDDDAGVDSGSTYVFARSGTSWSQQAKLTVADGAAGDQFGFSVAISGDTAIIGARGDDDAGVDSGSTYVFARSGTSWGQQAMLTAADGAAGDFFGISVAVSGDTAIIGATRNDGAAFNSGSGYAFIRSGTSWSQQAKLTAADGAEDDFFGRSVAVSGDSAVIGVPFDDDTGVNSGSAYVFSFGITVTIDIKPGSDPNSINLGSAGVVPVAILSTADFDAPAEVDPDTVGLAGARVKMVGKSNKYLCHSEDVNGDAIADLVCQVETAQFMIEAGDSLAILEAETIGGISVRGEDSIKIVP